MQPDVQLHDDSIILNFEALGSVEPFIQKALEEKGFFITLPRQLKLFGTVSVRITHDQSFEIGFHAEVLQIFENGPASFGTAFQITDWSDAKRKELAHKLKLASRPEAQPVAGASIPPLFRIKQMNVTEKTRLAMKANRTERQILVRDNSPQVFTALLANPRLEEHDVLEIVKSPFANAGILQRIAKDRRWSGNYEIRHTLVRNPKFPSPLAIKLLEALRVKDLQVLAKGSNARENIRRAALRLYLKRSGR